MEHDGGGEEAAGVASNGFGWLRVASGGFGWLPVASGGFGWLREVSRARVAPDGSGWLGWLWVDPEQAVLSGKDCGHDSI